MAWRRIEFWRGWLWPIAVAVTVTFASGRGQVGGPSVSHFDKIAHFSVFGLLATLVARQLGLRRMIWAIVIVSSFGLFDELRQGFTPGRSMGLDDWAADTAGAVVATVAYVGWRSYRELLERPLWGQRAHTHAKPGSSRPAASVAIAS